MWVYGYDHRNQLVLVEKQTSASAPVELRVAYAYDVFGYRLQKSVDADGDGAAPAQVTRFVVDAWKTGPTTSFVGTENVDVHLELDADGSLTTRYVRGDVIDELFARVDYPASGDPNPYWYLVDHQGSIRDIVDASGTVVNTITYDGYGNILAETNPTLRGNYAYTGREWEAEIGFQFNRGRYYDPSTGRWISQDPLGFDAGDSNLYRYVHNRPTGATDPSGLQSWGQVGGEVSGAAAAVGPWKVVSKTNESGAESYQPRLLFLKGAQPSPADIKRFLLDSDRAKIQRRKEMGYPLPGDSATKTKMPIQVPTHLLTLQEIHEKSLDESWGYTVNRLPRPDRLRTRTGEALSFDAFKVITPERVQFMEQTRWMREAYVELILQPAHHQEAQAVRKPYLYIKEYGGDTILGTENLVRREVGPVPETAEAGKLGPLEQFAKTVMAGALTFLGLDFIVDGYEAATGKSYITGARLTPNERMISAAALGLPFVPGFVARRMGGFVDDIGGFNPIARHADDLRPRHLDPIPGGGGVAPVTSTVSRIFQSEVSVMTPDQVQRALRSGGYTGNTTWAYSIHDHHFYPRWLGGQEAGPLLRVRGFEHITDLEPALFAHMQRAIPGLTERTAANVQRLISQGRVTQQQIAQALFDFYKARYPHLSDEAILNVLRSGL